jgi:NlpC/P60 family
MREEKAQLGWIASQRLVLALGLAWICLIGLATAEAEVADSTQELASTGRLLTAEEGRSIVTAAREQPARGTQDCSHVVHRIYRNAGFEYPYVSSFQVYAGNKSFARVRFPHAGDLVVWPGHMGIVVNPLKHSFYSLVSTGLEEQDYEAPYWKSRGKPRFYRYRVQNPGVLSVTKTPVPPEISNSNKQRNATTMTKDQSSEEASASNQPPKTSSKRAATIYGPPAPAELAKLAPVFEIPSSIVIVAGSEPPTREEVREGISKLSEAAGNLLRLDDPFDVQLPVVIVESISVQRVEIKRNHGWAQLQIDSKVSIDGGASQLKARREKIRWELRHTELGWEAVTPSDRAYVSHDVAVRNLAAQLARLTESNGEAAHLEPVLRQESQLAKLLNALLDNN